MACDRPGPRQGVKLGGQCAVAGGVPVARDPAVRGHPQLYGKHQTAPACLGVQGVLQRHLQGSCGGRYCGGGGGAESVVELCLSAR